MASYYVSTNGCDSNDGLTINTPWKTIKKANETIKGGDTVSFKCGDVFYGRIYPPSKNDTSNATVYTSYGSGAKPVISQYKTAINDVWEPVENGIFYGGIWRMDLTNINNFTGNITDIDTNVGFIKVDGAIYPQKCFSIESLKNQWDFYNDDKYVYVKSEREPSAVASDIKFACNIHCMKFIDNVIVENIVFMGTGAHGLQGTVHNAIVRNCEFHEIGGSELANYGVPGVRYGNGIECWTDSNDVLVENCRFSGIYDVAITMQGDNVTQGWTNMIFRNNVMWNCQQCFEIWSRGELPNTGFKNCVFENNVCIDSGYCWGYEVRPNKACSSHLLMYTIGCPVCDITIKGNTFYRARVAPIYCGQKLDSKFPEDYKIIDNTFFIEPNQKLVEYYRHFNKQENQKLIDTLKENNHVIETSL